MHWYKKNIGDYMKKAGRLTMLQHGAYTLLIDSCYDRERFPTEAEAIEWCWASTDDELAAVRFVLGKFFDNHDGVYVQKRIAEELEEYQAKCLKNQVIAVEREAKRKTKRTRKSTSRAQSVNESPPNQEPITKNQEPSCSPSTVVTDEHRKAVKLMWDKIKAVSPKAREPDLEKWADEYRLLCNHFNVEPREAFKVFAWANRDEFWKTNILSVKSLRKKFPDLDAKARAEKIDQPGQQEASPEIQNIARINAKLAMLRSQHKGAIDLNQPEQAEKLTVEIREYEDKLRQAKQQAEDAGVSTRKSA